ncbi:MAG: DNA repair protein RecO [Chloroflexi bacterium]|nr:DNA repair protein RecO [Chloroflexota bacterium]
MGTDRLYHTEGIVMRRRDQGEADRVLTLCTPAGKAEVIAKGVRKVRSHKAGHVELFSRSSFIISRVNGSWDIISQAETVEPHTALRSDLMRGAYSRYVVELADLFFAQDEGGQALFDLLDLALTWLCEDQDLDRVARFYEQHLLGLAGYRPELFLCVGEHSRALSLNIDQRNRSTLPYGFDPARGGALCQACYAASQDRDSTMALSSQGLQFLQDCQRLPYVEVRSLRISSATEHEIERSMRNYIQYHLERGINSLAFLGRLKQESNLVKGLAQDVSAIL